MKTDMVLSATGRDRVGVADDLAKALEKRGISIEEGRWMAVGGRFSVMAQVTGEHADVARLEGELASMCTELGFELTLEPIEPPRPARAAPRFLIECFTSRPADMNAVTGLLKNRGINIDHLETEAGGDLLSSVPTFSMSARVAIPPASFREVEEELRQLESDWDLDVVIKPIEARTGKRELVGTPDS